MTLALPQVECASPSERLLRALAPFGLVVQRCATPQPPRVDAALRDRILAQPPGSVTLCAGPSGCGKSSLLRAVSRAARERGVRVIDATTLLRRAATDRPIIDLFTLPVVRTLRVISAAGLGEAPLWARSAGELSEGQRARLAVALAMARAGARRGEHPTLLVLDEFCSTLDRVTARCVARTLRRWVSASRARAVCATAHDDLLPDLAPDLTIRTDTREITP